MPGIVVAVGGIGIDRLRAAVKKLHHVPSHSFNAVSVSSQLGIGWVAASRNIDSHSSTGDSGSGIYVWRFGHTFSARPAVIGAADILRDYLSRGVEAAFEYEGSFVIVIADLRTQRLYVVPDRLSTQPLYYTRRGDQIVVGPEVKALGTALGATPNLSPKGVIGFLTAGYNVGQQSLFADVHRVELGKMLEISLDSSRQLEARRFWKLDFGSVEKIRRRHDAEDALFAAMKEGHRLLLADKPDFQILLSGGADSRGMLGTCSKLGVMPSKAVTWGLLQNVPRSDASISRALAEQFGVPWDFIVTDTDGFVANCEQWAYVSELSNDNFGWYTEGFGTLNYLHDAGYQCSFIGDESWGCQGFAYSEIQAHEKVLPANVPPSLLALMPKHVRDSAVRAYANNIRETMRDCKDTEWNERKDFLYLHARVARFIFSLGYNRGHVTEHRRPFLTRPVLEVIRRLPSELRVYKNLYRTTLHRHLPATMRVPYASVNSLPDWSYDLRVRQPLKDRFLELLHDPIIDTGTLAEIFDVEAFRALRDAFYAETPVPMVRATRASKVLKANVKEVLWQLPVYKHLDRWVNSSRHKPLQRAKAEPIDILRRVAILVLLERQLRSFASVNGARDAA